MQCAYLGIHGSTREQVLGDGIEVQPSNRSGVGFVFKYQRIGSTGREVRRGLSFATTTYSEPFKIFSASHTETSPVSIPAARTPLTLAWEGDDHASRLNLRHSVAVSAGPTARTCHSPRIGADAALGSGLTFSSELEPFLVIGVEKFGRPDLEMTDIAKRLVECTGHGTGCDERQGRGRGAPCKGRCPLNFLELHDEDEVVGWVLRVRLDLLNFWDGRLGECEER